MADFVDNFLDGLKERRQREDLQAARAEQTRQFERQAAARMFEFSADNAARQAQFNLNRSQIQRTNQRQDLQDQINAADLFATGKAEGVPLGSEEAVDQNTPIVEYGGQRMRFLSPEEQAKRKFQLDLGLTRNRIEESSKTAYEVGGPEVGKQFDRIMKDPQVLSELLLGVRTGRPQIPQSFQAAIIRDTEAKVADGEITRQQADADYRKLITQQNASQALRIAGLEGITTNPPTYEQQRDAKLSRAAATFRDFVPELTGMNPAQIIANPEEALRKVTVGLKSKVKDPDLIGYIPTIAQEIIKDVVDLNKKPATKTSIFDQLKGNQQSNDSGVGIEIPDSERQNLGLPPRK